MRYILTSADQYFIDIIERDFGAPDVIVTEPDLQTNAPIRFTFHQCYKADYGDHQHYGACSAQNMAAMANCQAQYYRMSDRFAINREFNFRANSYYKHLGTWMKLLEGIDFVVFSNIPHEGYDWVLYNAAKLMGVKTYMYYIMPMRPGLPVIKYLLTDALDHAGSACLHDLKDYPEEMVTDFLLGYGKALKGEKYKPYTGAIPMSNVISSKLQGTNLSTIKEKIGKAISRTAYSIFRILEGDEYSGITSQRNKYWDKTLPLDGYEKCLYFPLHYQPECTSSPLGGHYVEQDLLVKLIASVMQDDHCILVKDHPRPSLKLRYRQFFKDLKRQKNVFLVDVSENPKPLLERADAVIGLTGTSLWEALCMGKPVFMAGSIIFENAPNVAKIDDTKSVEKAFKNLNSLNVDEATIHAYFNRLKPYLFPGVISPKDEGPYSPVTPEQSAQFSLTALKNSLQRDGLLK